MGEHGRQSQETRILVDLGCLHRCDLVPAQALAHNLEAARERGIPENAVALPRKWRVDGRKSDFSGLVSSVCALASAAAMVPIASLDRCMAALHAEKVEADRAGFGALGANPMADRLLGVFWHQALQFGLGFFVLEKGVAGGPKDGSELAQALDVLMSTIRTASMRGRGGSTPKR